jgi:hypothetical protein
MLRRFNPGGTMEKPSKTEYRIDFQVTFWTSVIVERDGDLTFEEVYNSIEKDDLYHSLEDAEDCVKNTWYGDSREGWEFFKDNKQIPLDHEQQQEVA